MRTSAPVENGEISAPVQRRKRREEKEENMKKDFLGWTLLIAVF